ncbi:methyltransferase domain-containing protein [Paenibacillus sp. MAHUQ-46]|uniref:Methyltransferase domain-containing protein n=2 Tax=Paenibacillus TaxID=44249 RepID=A0A934J2N4_9BACL|nr:SAM-dependent methyltransferase [Paenibacillus roseus]MBJ6363661.1 methyltransferase domain-containing protein [Paenibacillus roseus]
MEELRRLFKEIKLQQLSSGEVFSFEVPEDREQVLTEIEDHEPIFLRHIQPVDHVITFSEDTDDLEELVDIVRDARKVFEGKRTAVHLRRVENSPFPYSAADTKAVVEAILIDIGSELSLQQPEQILSLYASKDSLLIGWGTPRELLSDWPGGAVRFQREEGQISRAKFKLLEAERTFGINLAEHKRALDIGAAPGGWTSLLLDRGLDVTAIDPAELHPSLVSNRRLTYLKKNASEVKFSPNSFDLIVCDMSWSPMQMGKLVLDLSQALSSGGDAIVTIKLMHRKPLQTIRDVMQKLQEVFIIRKAKQLFHNRDEITLLLEKR